MPITDPTQEYFKNGGWGWNGSAWVKLPVLWGFYDQWVEDLGGVKSGAGIYEGNSTAVPAGEVWVMQYAALCNDTGQRGDVFFDLMGGVDWGRIGFQTAPLKYVPTIVKGPLALCEGDFLKARQLSCLDADVIRASVWGYKMKVT